eukprot:jgi/Psemu1/296418/fgenesh1_pm.156_\
MSSLAATQSDGYYLPPEYFESGAYRKQSKNQFAAAAEAAKNGSKTKSGDGRRQPKTGHNQWLKHGVVRFELPEKAICLGCRQSVGRGTRFNAKKITTDEHYFSTKIIEFRLSCRNCQQPWVIRTNPKDRGFDYISGVKRQAGQEKNLVTGSSDRDGTGEKLDNFFDDGHRGSLDRLETAALMKIGAKKALTEIEELEQIRQLNEVSSSVNDADTNASIRKVFRRDRKEKRKRLGEATEKGWRDGMMILPSNEHDILAANDTCYGRPAEDEKRRLSCVRKSSIFSSSGTEGNKRKSRRQSRLSSPVRSKHAVASRKRNITRSQELAMAVAPTTTNPVADEVGSYSNLVTGRTRIAEKKKQTLQLRLGQSGISILEKIESVTARKEIGIENAVSDLKAINKSASLALASSPLPSSSATNTRVETDTKPPCSLSEMMMTYGSDDDSS